MHFNDSILYPVFSKFHKSSSTLDNHLSFFFRQYQDIGFSSMAILLVVYQIGSALDHIHNVGVIHRDVKMENILIGEGNSKNHHFYLFFALSINFVI